MKEYECEASLDNLQQILALASEEMTVAETEVEVRQKVFIVLEELFNNIVNYAYINKEIDKEFAIVKFWFIAEQDSIMLRLFDRGEAFNPLLHDDQNRLDNLDILQEGGAGIFLVKSLSSSVRYERENDFNMIEVII